MPPPTPPLFPSTPHPPENWISTDKRLSKDKVFCWVFYRNLALLHLWVLLLPFIALLQKKTYYTCWNGENVISAQPRISAHSQGRKIYWAPWVVNQINMFFSQLGTQHLWRAMSVNLCAVPLNHSKKLWGRVLYPLFNSFRMWQMEVLSVSTMSITYNTLFKDVNNGHKEQYF